MSNAYSSRSRPNSLKSAIEGVNSRKALEPTTTVSPRKALELARKEKVGVENRVRYLANEQERYQKKIEKARKEVERRNLIKAGKIDDLKVKIQAQKERQ